MILFAACGRSGEPVANEGVVSTGNEAVESGATSGTEAAVAALKDFPDADFSGYAGLEGVEEFATYKDVTVADIAALVDAKETFVFLASFEDCPWCNAVIAELNAAAREAGIPVGSLDTRKNPAWKNNLDIDNYDLFVEYFGDYLEDDEDGRPHLYVPHIFFLCNGEVVYQHQGALAEMGNDPNMVLTDEQEEALIDIFRRGFATIR